MSSIGLTLSFKQVHKLSRYFEISTVSFVASATSQPCCCVCVIKHWMVWHDFVYCVVGCKPGWSGGIIVSDTSGDVGDSDGEWVDTFVWCERITAAAGKPRCADAQTNITDHRATGDPVTDTSHGHRHSW